MTVSTDVHVDEKTTLSALLEILHNRGLRAVRDDGADVFDSPITFSGTEEVTVGILSGLDPEFVDVKKSRFRRTRSVRVPRDWIGSITLNGTVGAVGVAYGSSSATEKPLLPDEPDDDEYAAYRVKMSLFHRRVLTDDEDSLVIIADVFTDLRHAMPNIGTTMYHRAEYTLRSEKLVEETDGE